MKILSIETSCDETAVSVLDISVALSKPEIKVLGNSLLSQIAIHEEYGGVYPMLAKREHQKNLPILLEKSLKEAGIDPESPDIDFIAVTSGPGLEPALWTGITFAEELGKKWGKPVVPVNHMEGHIWSVLFNIDKPVVLPAIALLVSGGHTELVYIKNFGDYEILGRTLDDAVGEAFDKVARMLGEKYPGGPKISKLAQEARREGLKPDFKFTRPMLNSGDLNFSFSGLKTAVLYKTRDRELTSEFKIAVAREFEDTVVETLVEKTRTAIESHPEIKTLIIAGGVAGNSYLQEKFRELMNEYREITLLIPVSELSTDNAVMIGIAGFVKVSCYPQVLEKTCRLAADGNLSLNDSHLSRTGE